MLGEQEVVTDGSREETHLSQLRLRKVKAGRVSEPSP